MKCSHYWDVTDIPEISMCFCGASRVYDREKHQYIVTVWEDVEDE